LVEQAKESPSIIRQYRGSRNITNAFLAFMAIVVLVLLAYVGAIVLGWQMIFGIVIPYFAILLFVFGLLYRILLWAGAPVPFHIVTTCGQQKSLPWIKSNEIESPTSTTGVVVRMALEILLFRSLFRNEKVELKRASKLIFGGNRWLWLAGLAMHWSLLIIIFRHLRLFIQPVPDLITFVGQIDGIFQIAIPTLYITDLVVLLAVSFLFLRRIFSPQARYISLFSDYLAILLIAGVALSGVLMRLFFRTDLLGVKELAVGVLTFHPSVQQGVGLSFYIHLFLVSFLVAYFPYSKMVHAPGIFLSPTRNLKNNSRERRHVNPWSHPVKVHTYEEWENDFRAPMKKAGLPVEKE
jgi:nitrate reductase gamma subunit